MRCSQALMVLLLSTISQVSFSAEDRAKDFTLPSVANKSLIHLSDYSGKVVLVNWWRTSCPWSQKESPRLVELYKQLKNDLPTFNDDPSWTLPILDAP